MDSFELNKIAGAVLGTLLFAMGLRIAADIIWSDAAPAKPGYVIEVAEAKPAGGEAAAPAAMAAAPIAERMKTASVDAGKKVFGKCTSCHNAEKGGKNGQGPNLYNVVGGPKAHMEGFGYSGGLQEMAKSGGKWGYEELDKFLTKPAAYVQGTKMNFPGIDKPDERAAVIAYLRSQSDNPPPMP
jgi:cytochrome c